jgi:hypothetical protein
MAHTKQSKSSVMESSTRQTRGSARSAASWNSSTVTENLKLAPTPRGPDGASLHFARRPFRNVGAGSNFEWRRQLQRSVKATISTTKSVVPQGPALVRPTQTVMMTWRGCTCRSRCDDASRQDFRHGNAMRTYVASVFFNSSQQAVRYLSVAIADEMKRFFLHSPFLYLYQPGTQTVATSER